MQYSLDASKDLFQSSINDDNENHDEDDPNDELFDKLQKDLEEVNIEVGEKADAAEEEEAHSSKEPGSEEDTPKSDVDDLEKQFEAEMLHAGLQMKDLSMDEQERNVD